MSQFAPVVWCTGLSGAGKTTICQALAAELRTAGHKVKILDGDELRHGICSGLGFSLEDRAENIRRIAHVARLLAECGVTVLVAAISPLEVHRACVRSLIPGVIEVFVDAPLSVCEKRDTKGLYRKARANQMTNLTGLGSPYEPPPHPDVVCHTDRERVDESVARILSFLAQQGSAEQA